MNYNTVYVEYGNISSYATIIRKIDSKNYLVYVDSISKIVQIEKQYIKDLNLYYV
jgi:hypothetical protein